MRGWAALLPAGSSQSLMKCVTAEKQITPQAGGGHMGEDLRLMWGLPTAPGLRLHGKIGCDNFFFLRL